MPDTLSGQVKIWSHKQKTLGQNVLPPKDLAGHTFFDRTMSVDQPFLQALFVLFLVLAAQHSNHSLFFEGKRRRNSKDTLSNMNDQIV